MQAPETQRPVYGECAHDIPRVLRHVISDLISRPHGDSDDGAGGSCRQLLAGTLADATITPGSGLLRKARGGITVQVLPRTEHVKHVAETSLRANEQVRSSWTDRTRRGQARAGCTVSSSQLPQSHARSHAFYAHADWHADACCRAAAHMSLRAAEWPSGSSGTHLHRLTCVVERQPTCSTRRTCPSRRRTASPHVGCSPRPGSLPRSMRPPGLMSTTLGRPPAR